MNGWFVYEFIFQNINKSIRDICLLVTSLNLGINYFVLVLVIED